MFLLLALIVQIVQIHGDLHVSCELILDTHAQRNYDYGNDYMKWIRVSSLNECARECESTVNGKSISTKQQNARHVCQGITWVKGGNRNCALYNSDGMTSG